MPVTKPPSFVEVDALKRIVIINAISDKLKNEEHKITLDIYYPGVTKVLKKINFYVIVDLQTEEEPESK